jgi:hypothetical protein
MRPIHCSSARLDKGGCDPMSAVYFRVERDHHPSLVWLLPDPGRWVAEAGKL